MSALDQVASWPGEPAAVAVVGAGGGGADGGTGAGADGVRAVVGDLDAPRRWASVTKLVTALAVLVEVESGTVDLDEPAGPPGPPPSTVRHLLAHASGLAFDRRRALAAPGRRRLYSNAGFEVLGDLLTARTGAPAADHLRGAILEPLGMSATRLAGTTAAGMVGPLRDLVALARELMEPTLLAPETMELAHAVAFPGLTGVLPGFGRQDPNDWGLGFELRGHKSPHWTGTANSARTFGHFGQSGSFVWVDPDASLACACLAGADFGPWAAQAWPPLADAVLADYG